MVPEGAKRIDDPQLKFPIMRWKNVYIFPGIPEYLQGKIYRNAKIF